MTSSKKPSPRGSCGICGSPLHHDGICKRCEDMYLEYRHACLKAMEIGPNLVQIDDSDLPKVCK